MVNITETMMKLIKRAVCAEGELPACNLSEETVAELYELSKLHDLTHLLTASIEKIEALRDSALLKEFQKQTFMAVYRYERIKYELERVCAVLEEAKIRFVPLKGSVLRNYYREPWMRTSCDIDVYVDKSEVDNALAVLKQKFSYSEQERSARDISLFSKSGVHTELHFDLMEDEQVNGVSEILNDVWSYATQADGCCYRHELSDEMFYFYHIAHMAKHFEIGGCGVRPFLDLWILNHRIEYDPEKRNALLEKGRLSEFANAAKHLSEVWFGDEEHTEKTKLLEDYLINAGVYGNSINRIAVNYAKKGSKLKYVLSRIWIPYDRLKYVYPSLENRRMLTPFYQVKRWCRVFSKEERRKLSSEAKTASNQTAEKVRKTEKLFDELGLNIK